MSDQSDASRCQRVWGLGLFYDDFSPLKKPR